MTRVTMKQREKRNKPMIRCTVLSLMTSMMMTSIYASTIDVTTFADEDGENTSACSLREALKASELEKPYGGCAAGKRNESETIQLRSGKYILTRGELIPNSVVVIRGKNSIDINQRDSITGLYDARLPLSTEIQTSGIRAFNTSVTRASLTLQELIIDGGISSVTKNEYGGAILNGGSLSLRKVVLRSNRATVSGGALYLEGSLSSLNAEDTIFENNSARQAAVLGMTCIDNLKLTGRSIEINRASVVANGSSSTDSIFDFCGIPNAKLTNVTISSNQVSRQPNSGVLSFLDDNFGGRTGLNSILELKSVTLVGNLGSSALLYDGRGQIRITNSILAYNENFDCRYLSRNNVRLRDVSGIVSTSNLVGGFRRSPSTDRTITYEEFLDLPLTYSCQLPSNIISVPLIPVQQGADVNNNRFIDYDRIDGSINNSDSNTYTGSTPQNQILYPLSDYGTGLKGLLPKKSADASIVSAVDRGATLNECGLSDQRGVSRQSGVKINLSNDFNTPRCDIGAMELGQVTVNDDGDGLNLSYVEQLAAQRFSYTEQELAQFSQEERTLISRVTQEENQYKDQLKKNFSFRRAFVDILNNDVPQETVSLTTNPPSSSFVKLYSGDYSVTNLISYGTGPDVLLNDQAPRDDSKNADLVKCVWIESMKRLAVYRTDGVTTPSGSFERCAYTLEAPDGTRSSGLVQVRIDNIPPIAKNDQYLINRGAEQLIIDILQNDNDDGDGPVGTLHQPANRLPFFSGVNQVNIKIVKAPQLGKLIFEREAPCPDNTATSPNQICYGGRATYLVNNTFSPFNDSFEYVVLDQDRAESNVATVEIINSATTTEDTRDDRKGILAGGGALGWLGLFGLVSLAVVAQRRRRM